MKINDTLPPELARDFYRAIDALARAAPVEDTIREVARGERTVPQAPLGQASTAADRALLRLGEAVAAANRGGVRHTLPEWFEIVTQRSLQAVQEIRMAPAEAAQRLERAQATSVRLLGVLAMLAEVPSGALAKDRAYFVGLVQGPMVELNALLGPLRALHKDGALDPVAAARLRSLDAQWESLRGKLGVGEPGAA